MMLRSTACWSLTFVLVLGGFVACSSKSSHEGTGLGGAGAIVGGSSTGACQFTSDCDDGLVCDIKRELCVVCRTNSDCGPHSVCEANDCVKDETGGGASTGGTSGSGGSVTGGTATTTGGTATGGTATGGNASGACTDTAVTCVDAMTASVCDPSTGQTQTFNCANEFKDLGITSNGCKIDLLNGTGCTLDAFADPPCWDGAQAIAFCEHLTDSDLIDIYFSCYTNAALQDNGSAHELVTCFNQFVSPTMTTNADCAMAESDCAPGAGGAPPVMTDTGGAGGAP